jgi:hypothetical protein
MARFQPRPHLPLSLSSAGDPCRRGAAAAAGRSRSRSAPSTSALQTHVLRVQRYNVPLVRALNLVRLAWAVRRMSAPE